MSSIKAEAEQSSNNALEINGTAYDESVTELDAMTTAVNRRCATLTQMLGQAQAEVVGIGQDLIAIRAYIQEQKVPGGFDGWLSRDFKWSPARPAYYAKRPRTQQLVEPLTKMPFGPISPTKRFRNNSKAKKSARHPYQPWFHLPSFVFQNEKSPPPPTEPHVWIFSPMRFGKNRRR